MLFGWMKNLIVYLIFAGAVINLSPSGSYKKHIRLVTGLVAIIIIIKPISAILNYDERKLYTLFDKAYEQGQLVIHRDLYGLEKGEINDIEDYYELSLGEGIKHELNERGLGVTKVSVVTDGDNNVLNCRVYAENTDAMDTGFQENNIKNYINEVYNLEFDNIYVVRR